MSNIVNDWKPYNGEDYLDEAWLDIRHNGYVYLCAYSNAGKVDLQEAFPKHPLLQFESIKQDDIGFMLECKPSHKHPLLMEGYSRWITEEEYEKYTNCDNEVDS